jgi:N-carbamoyl-L-amino-acid hydrolase
MEKSNMRVDGSRLRASLEEMALIGATPAGGVQRLALSDEDKRARDLFASWLEEMSLAVSIDEMGNIFGRRAGRNDGLAPVMMGSHIDSQPRGGRFDGILGVMGALEVMRTLNDHEVPTERPLEIVDWTNEEGSRFAPAMVSSGVWSGALQLAWAYGRTDINGKKQGEELARIGYRGTVPARKRPVHAYYEYHIEQGPLLERQGKTIGAPKGIVCLHWYDVHLAGEANQVGPTPMEGRHDALCSAAEMILAVNNLPQRMGGNLVEGLPGDLLPPRHPDAHRGNLESEASPLRPQAGPAGSGYGRRAGLPGPAHGERGRARCQLHESGLPHGHDLRAQHRRAQPRRGGEHELAGLRGRGQRAPALHTENRR